MNYNLYFLPANRSPELIKTWNSLSEEDIFIAINADIKKRNSKFKIYYIRHWGDINFEGITYDIGSHTEFYKIKREEI